MLKKKKNNNSLIITNTNDWTRTHRYNLQVKIISKDIRYNLKAGGSGTAVTINVNHRDISS